MGKKGLRSERGKGEEWDEAKSERLNLKLTPTGRRLLQEQADKLDISISEVIERTARGLINFSTQENTNRLPTLEQVRQVLSRLSGSVLADITIYASELMRGYFHRAELTASPAETIAQLVTIHWDKCVEGLEGAITPKRLEELKQGMKPTAKELEPLSTVLPLSLDELETIWRRDFRNGSKPGCPNLH
jgi:hypothetical protein